MKPKVTPFGSAHVQLRLIEEADLPTTLGWRNREDARIWFKNSTPLTLESHQAWYQSYKNKENDFLFIVESKGQKVGQVSVYDIDLEKRTAEVGRFLVAPEASGQGYMREACQVLLAWCAETLEISSVFLQVLDNNERAQNLYHALGFIEEKRAEGLIIMRYNLFSAMRLGTADEP